MNSCPDESLDKSGKQGGTAGIKSRPFRDGTFYFNRRIQCLVR